MINRTSDLKNHIFFAFALKLFLKPDSNIGCYGISSSLSIIHMKRLFHFLEVKFVLPVINFYDLYGQISVTYENVVHYTYLTDTPLIVSFKKLILY